MYPKVDELEKQRIINKLNKLKKRIEEGEDFSFLASLRMKGFILYPTR